MGTPRSGDARGLAARMTLVLPCLLSYLHACGADDELRTRRRATWQDLFSVWSTLSEQKWSTFRERRGNYASSAAPRVKPESWLRPWAGRHF